MDFGKKISAATAALVLLSTTAAFPTTVAYAAVYDDSSYTTLSEGDIVQIDTFEELCHFSNYVNSGGTTNGITWQLTADIQAGNYTYNFDESTGLVTASDAEGNAAFCLGTGVLETELGVVYAVSSLSSDELTITSLPDDAVTSFSTIAADSSTPFNGVFDGNGYTISGFYGVNSIFGYLKDAEIHNLTISDSYFYNYGNSSDVASLALISKATDISYVTVEDTFVGSASNGNIGGIIASVESKVADSDDAASLLASQFIGNSLLVNGSGSGCYTGGLIGTTNYAGGGLFSVNFCNCSADIYGNSSGINGIVGLLAYTFTVNSSLYTGNVHSGAVGFWHGGTFTDTYQIASQAQQDLCPSGIQFDYITAEQVASGEMAYTMENLRKASDIKTSVFWTQNLSSDSAPALTTSDDYLVYYEDGIYTNEAPDTPVFETPDIIKKFGKDYYQIDNYSELCWFAYAYNNGTAETANAVLNADITADEGSVWTPIGVDSSTPYTGVFLGERNTVSGLNVPEGTNVGLFGYTSDATIQQVGVENSTFAGTIYVAPLAGVAVSSNIIDCYAYNNSITCSSTSSGFVASAQNTSITTSYTDSDKGLIGGGSCNIFGCYHAGTNSYGTAVTAEQISSGYLAYMLKQYSDNMGLANNWGQDLSKTDSYPVLDTDYEVFCNGNGYDNESPSDHAHINVECNSDGTHSYDCSYCLQHIVENCRFSEGFCTICGYFDNSAEYIVYPEAGTYTLPTARQTSATEQIVGWISEDGYLYQCGSEITVNDTLTLYKVTLNINTIGASAKINNDSTGIKFATSLEIIGADYSTLDMSVGTLICPTDYVTNDSVLDYNNFINNGYIALIEDAEDAYFSEIVVNNTTYSNSYVGSIVNINAYNYAREFTGCGFVEITYADNSVSYFYATSKSSQSIYTLAAKAYGDRVQTADDDYINETADISGNVYYSRYTADELDVLKRFMDGVVNFDIDLANQGVVEIIIPEEVSDFYESAYSASVNYADGVISIIGADDWNCYIPVTKSTGITEYQRVAIMINGKRISYSNTSDNFEVPVTSVDAGSDAVTQSTMTINLIGI